MLTVTTELQVSQRENCPLSIQLAIEKRFQLQRELAAAVLGLVRGIGSW